MKLSCLFLETDLKRRELEREAAIGNVDAERGLARNLIRSGEYDTEIPEELRGTPSKILKVHAARFDGARWREFEDLILDFKNTKSFEMGRVGDMTFPTLVAARYALQLSEPWPAFIPLAENMMKFLLDPGHTGGGYATPLRSGRIRTLPLLVAEYLIRHQISPPWITQLYDSLREMWEDSLRPWRQDAETGEAGSNVEGELYRDSHGRVVFNRRSGNVGSTDEEEVKLSRIVPQLEKLL